MPAISQERRRHAWPSGRCQRPRLLARGGDDVFGPVGRTCLDPMLGECCRAGGTQARRGWTEIFRGDVVDRRDIPSTVEHDLAHHSKGQAFEREIGATFIR